MGLTLNTFLWARGNSERPDVMTDQDNPDFTGWRNREVGTLIAMWNPLVLFMKLAFSVPQAGWKLL
jgi:hypothetical protein